MSESWCIVDAETNEVIACINSNNKDSIIRNDMKLEYFKDSEPVFHEEDNKIFLSESTFTIKIDPK